MLIPALTLIKSNAKIFLTLAVVLGIVGSTMKLTHDYTENKVSKVYIEEINTLKELEAERIRELNKNLFAQMQANNILVKEKQEFTTKNKKLQKELTIEREKLKNDSENSKWLSTPIPPAIIDWLRSSGNQTRDSNDSDQTVSPRGTSE